MEPVLLAVCRGFKLEKSELDGALGEGGVEVKHVVAAVVVMPVPAVAGSVALVPNVCKLAHGGRLLFIQPSEEVGVNCPAVAADSVTVQVQGAGQELFVARHDVGQVAQGLRGVALSSDVNVNSAAAGRVAFCSGLAELADQLLQGVHVCVGEDRGDHLAFVSVVTVDADIALEFPFVVLCIPG